MFCSIVGGGGSSKIRDEGIDTPIKFAVDGEGSSVVMGDPGLESMSVSLSDDALAEDWEPIIMNSPVLYVRTRLV